jgi:hypothetical protein
MSLHRSIPGQAGLLEMQSRWKQNNKFDRIKGQKAKKAQRPPEFTTPSETKLIDL